MSVFVNQGPWPWRPGARRRRAGRSKRHPAQLSCRPTRASSTSPGPRPKATRPSPAAAGAGI